MRITYVLLLNDQTQLIILNLQDYGGRNGQYKYEF